VLPPTAIGKDFLLESIVAAAPSKSGYQLSLGGMLGVLVAREEGIELNLLGLTFGIDFTPIAILLPGVGRLGLEAPVPEMVASPERLNERPEN
ncbi:MAG: hypothetical protein UMU75_05920, partial [Halomonas sp.]|nr:hypothetical protein [Halomonas sp.]